MALRGKQPEAVEKRLKALFYGGAGVGKTTAAIQFPRPYLIDTEKGAENDQYLKALKKAGGAIFQTADFHEVLAEVKTLLSEKHDYKTLIIDPLTVIYNDLLEKADKKVGSEFGRHYNEANKSMKILLSLLLKLDMNVIITSHAKNEYGDGMKVLGTTYDCYKKLDYLFDLVFEIQKRGKERLGIIKKSRIESFPDADNFPFTYDTIADKYGRKVLERDAVPVELASDKQVKELNRLIELLSVPKENIDKWLSKADAEDFSEMNQQEIQKCIDYLQSKIKGDTE